MTDTPIKKLDLKAYQDLTVKLARVGQEIQSFTFTEPESDYDRQTVLKCIRDAFHYLRDINDRREFMENPDGVRMTMKQKPSIVPQNEEPSGGS